MAPDDALKTSFPPVTNTATRVLVLGSLPGDRSLKERRYYAHPQNQFWALVGAAVGRDLASLTYPDRLTALLASGIGLWDVIGTARRQGSNDAAIRDHRANDLRALCDQLPHLRAIAFNGATAARIGTAELGAQDDGRGIARLTLPSSSPLHTVGVAAKLPDWMAIRDFLN